MTMGQKPNNLFSLLKQALQFRVNVPAELEKEFEEFKDIQSIDRIQVAAWIGFCLSVFLLPLDYSRMESGTLYTHPIYPYLFYLHLFGLLFLLPAWSMTYNKAWVKSTRWRRGIHIWGMVVMSYVFLFVMGALVFWDRDSLIIYMAFMFICNWMFAMSHKERLLFVLATLPIIVWIALVRPESEDYTKITKLYEITFLSIVALVFDTFDYNLRVSNFLAIKKNEQAEFENKVEAVMLQQFTSIHPSIQWRFRDEAIRLMNDRNKWNHDPDIRFENVFPFYGSLDIRNSSKKRRKAIAQDLLYNLEMGLNILQQSYEQLNLEILGELIIEVEKYIDKIKTDFSSGDEAGIANFIRTELSPVIEHLRKQYPQLESLTKNYQESCAESGICTLHRVGYEEAISLMIRNMITCLNEEEQDLQRLYPCYFEKFQTDGLEYNIYAGSSIARGRQLDPLYLDNLRLRQLLWTCKVMKKVDELHPQIQHLLHPVLSELKPNGSDHTDEKEINIAPLILAYMTPITLKFRWDEKRLDVLGSYNIRYEMLKKRIDKSIIHGTSERLTQPGFISIVYTQDQEMAAYEKHFTYLVKKNMIKPDWERLQLETMQGVEGLKALRVCVVN